MCTRTNMIDKADLAKLADMVDKAEITAIMADMADLADLADMAKKADKDKVKTADENGVHTDNKKGRKGAKQNRRPVWDWNCICKICDCDVTVTRASMCDNCRKSCGQ